MGSKRKKNASPRAMLPAWTVRGSPEGAPHPFEALAKRFVLEPGRTQPTAKRPANVVGMNFKVGELESDVHMHRESQLIFQAKGELTCEASSALWIVPPQSALWIPGGVLHKIRARGPLEGYSVFVEPTAAPTLPRECCSVSVTPLFRELMLRLATRPVHYGRHGPDARLVGVLLDELAAVSVEKHRLPMPTDPRLRRLVEAMTARPSDGATAKLWARRIGVGERTLSRLLVQETGLSFGRWRRQLHIILALQRLSRGAAVKSVASDLGYENASSFVTMFRKALGTSPARYMANRRAS